MTKRILSDEEKETLLSLSANPANLFTYINRLFADQTLGHDGCARPIAFRDKKHIKQPCFALGYVEKIEEYLNESVQRNPPIKAIVETQKYLKQIKAEITKFFS